MSGTRAWTQTGSSQRFSGKMTAKAKRRMEADLAKARTKDSVRALAKLCRAVDGELRIVGNPPLITPIEDVLPGAEQEHLDAVIRRMIHTYAESLSHDRRELLERYRYVHAARKVVGVGSVGTRAWILLLLGRDDGDPLFLQFKEAQASVLEPFLGKSRFEQHGQRIVAGQRMMQAAADIMLGWERIEAIDGETKDFYIRQLWDAKGSAEIELMNPARPRAHTESSAAGPSPEPTRDQATPLRSPRISAREIRSTGRWRRSARRTPIRTSATTRRFGRPRKRVASPFNTDCDRRASAA